MRGGGFNESSVFISKLYKSPAGPHRPASSLLAQFLLKLFASAIQSFFQSLYIPPCFGDNTAETRSPSIFLNAPNLNGRLEPEIARLMDSSPPSNGAARPRTTRPPAAGSNLAESQPSRGLQPLLPSQLSAVPTTVQQRLQRTRFEELPRTRQIFAGNRTQTRLWHLPCEKTRRRTPQSPRQFLTNPFVRC